VWKRLLRRAIRLAQGAAALAALAFLGFLAATQPQSVLANGSQVIVTLAFGISNPLHLQLVSFAGAALQTLFFCVKPGPPIWASIGWSGAMAVLNLAIAASLLRGGAGAAAAFSEPELAVARALHRAAAHPLAEAH